ncbi:hypothetical protein B0H12DRAFT_1074234 [Mycena haematopus]|nr:hypothetical protein B0H12DRAFT_1074234 [Mycena haematopus]
MTNRPVGGVATVPRVDKYRNRDYLRTTGGRSEIGNAKSLPCTGQAGGIGTPDARRGIHSGNRKASEIESSKQMQSREWMMEETVHGRPKPSWQKTRPAFTPLRPQVPTPAQVVMDSADRSDNRIANGGSINDRRPTGGVSTVTRIAGVKHRNRDCDYSVKAQSTETETEITITNHGPLEEGFEARLWGAGLRHQTRAVESRVETGKQAKIESFKEDGWKRIFTASQSKLEVDRRPTGGILTVTRLVRVDV